MFSRYKKSGAAPEQAAKVKTPVEMPKPQQAEAPKPTSLRRPSPTQAAAPSPIDKDRKRKERLAEIKLDLHRSLLDNLNLAALDTATESDLRAEISSIASEVLEERSIVLNREDRSTLTQELYDEVKGLGPLETLLKDDTVNDILVNGPHQIFVERDGKLSLSDVTFKVRQGILLGSEPRGWAPPAFKEAPGRLPAFKVEPGRLPYVIPTWGNLSAATF